MEGGLREGDQFIFYVVCKPGCEKLLAIFKKNMGHIPYNLAEHDSISSSVK